MLRLGTKLVKVRKGEGVGLKKKCGFVVTNTDGNILTFHQKDLPQTGLKNCPDVLLKIQHSHTYKRFLDHMSCHHHTL